LRKAESSFESAITMIANLKSTFRRQNWFLSTQNQHLWTQNLRWESKTGFRLNDRQFIAKQIIFRTCLKNFWKLI
jgi:hypothetical protein